MSAKGKNTTIHNVIERVRRSGIDEFTLEEAKEWAWEVMTLMGESSFYSDRVASLLIENARAKLPYDLYDISQGGVREYYSKLVLLKEGDIYYDPDLVGELNTSTNLTFEAPSILYVDGVAVDEGSVFLTSASNFTYDREELTYRIGDGYLYTGFKNGVVQIAYKAFPTDNNNNPLIPDDYKVIRMIVDYIALNVAERRFNRDEISERKLNHYEKKYAWSMASARSNSGLGSIDDWEAIRSRTQRLVRDPNLQRVGFRTYSYRENLDLS